MRNVTLTDCGIGGEDDDGCGVICCTGCVGSPGAEPPPPHALNSTIDAMALARNTFIAYDPPTLVVVTLIASSALCPPPPAIVNVQLPAATGVTTNTVKGTVIVAMPLHEFGAPAAAVDGVKFPV
jgi:hypothetical protein